jgi:hypothetical protein
VLYRCNSTVDGGHLIILNTINQELQPYIGQKLG